MRLHKSTSRCLVGDLLRARRISTPRHLALSVGSRDAVDRLVKEKETAGIRIVSRPRLTGDGYYGAVIADSEGNRLEITA